MDKVFCKQCAKFVVIHAESGERVEANHELRKTGTHIFLNSVGVKRRYVPQPICHEGRRSDWREFDPADDPSKLLSQIEMPLDCDGFAAYEPGRGPKELDQMNVQQATMELQAKLLRLQESVFEWRQQQADKDERFAKQIQALEETRHQENRGDTKSAVQWQVWAGIGVAVFAAVVSLVGIAIQVAYSG